MYLFHKLLNVWFFFFFTDSIKEITVVSYHLNYQPISDVYLENQQPYKTFHLSRILNEVSDVRHFQIKFKKTL